ncbi:MAG TPA: DUF4332 domain-containing protein [candidate division Zixibacteria bacterium]|nr:DUF4332 domain-containing protein [candidate division Zixibacteria bacterium]
MSDSTIDQAFGESRMPWWFLLVEGVVAIIVGILLLMNPYKMSVMLVQVLAIYWLVKGIVSLVSIFVDHSAWGWKLFIGIVGIMAGYILIKHPIGGTAVAAQAFIIVLGIQGIVIGIVELVQAFQGGGWGVGFLGAITTIIGIWLLANAWATARVVPWVLGIFAIIGGIVAIVYAARYRRAEQAAVIDEPEVDAEPPPAVQAAVVEEVVAAETEEVEAPELEEPAADEPVFHDTPGEEAKFHHEIGFIEGIGPKYGAALKEQGIETPLALLESGATPKGRKDLAEKTGISSKLILTWVNQTDLMRIKGIGSQYADLLEEAGVDTVPELARRNSTNLHEKVVEINEEKHFVRHSPSLHDIEAWIAEAKELPRVVKY